MNLPSALRQRASSAGLLDEVFRLRAGDRELADLEKLATGPLPLLCALATGERRSGAIVGLLPATLGDDVAAAAAAALAHRAAAEAEVIELHVRTPSPVGALDLACELSRRLLAALPGAGVRLPLSALHALARGAGVDPAGAAARLQSAGAIAVTGEPSDPSSVGPLPVEASLEVPNVPGRAFLGALLEGPRRRLTLRAAPDATGIALLRAVSLCRIAGHGPLAIRAHDELKGPDAALAFGADVLEGELDPPGTLGARTRSYGEAAVRGAQLSLQPARRRAPEGRRVPRILDEHVPEGLDLSLPVVENAAVTGTASREVNR